MYVHTEDHLNCCWCDHLIFLKYARFVNAKIYRNIGAFMFWHVTIRSDFLFDYSTVRNSPWS